ncbi:MAG: metallophosphoesterase [Spirochaetaceae bacterium]|jgi:predicted MPP superfamily phosphohydrolase|nr:metallophosphoesterase [Spirochaetaceae bacterium]
MCAGREAVKCRKSFFSGFFSVFSAFLLSCCATHAALQTVYYDVSLPPEFNGRGLVIALISDLHSDIYGKDQSPLLQRIVGISPDIIVLAGDIFDDIAPPAGTRLLLSGIKNLLPKIPVFYVTGNHEYDSGNIGEMLGELADFNIDVLANDYKLLESGGIPLVIAGIEDTNIQLLCPLYDTNLADVVLAEASAYNAYKILLCHRPEIALRYANYGFDLILSGHTHGGQVRLPPLLDGLYAPGQGLFPKYAGGLYRVGSGSIVVSRGLTTRRPLLPRIFNPPELVVIRLGGYTNLRER